MTDGPRAPPRVERALHVLPDLESVAPVRALLMALSRRDGRGVWASAGPYLTVGKHLVQPAELRERLPWLLEQVGAHLSALYEAVVEAFEADQRGDFAAEAAALLRAAEREEAAGRLRDARQWCEAALPLSGWIQERDCEIGILLRLGRLCRNLGRHTEAARHYQRAFTLGETGVDATQAIAAAEGLGRVALAQENWTGARAWLTRALGLAETHDDPAIVAGIEHRLATTALRRGDLGTAGEHLARARDVFERLDATLAMPRVLNTEGLLAARLRNPRRAEAAYREALAWIRRAGGDANLEAKVRLNLAALHVDRERQLEAEDEARRAERLAITHSLTRRLVEVYTFLGRLRGHQGDEMGFVFFEQALELCRGIDRSPALDGQVYSEYAAFRDRLGQHAEARELLERARDSLAQLGDVPQLDRVRMDLRRLSA